MGTPPGGVGGYGSEDNQPAYGPEDSPAPGDPEFVGPVPSFTIEDFFVYNPLLEGLVDGVYDSMDDKQRVGQLFVPSVGESGRFKTGKAAESFLEEVPAGGIFLFKGNTQLYKDSVTSINKFFKDRGWIPPIYSVDAEPHLMKIRVTDWPSGRIENDAAKLDSSIKIDGAVAEINKWMKEIGAHQNFAPVLDLNKNTALGGWQARAFSDDPAKCIELSNAFIDATQKDNLIATAKHFPGLGALNKDPHEELVINEGALKELDNYAPVIENKVLSIMPTHIIVKGNTDGYNTESGLPAIMSRKLITDLLRTKLKFNGLIITDGLNMHGAEHDIRDVNITQQGLKCIKAGCDQLLMPRNPKTDFKDIMGALSDANFRSQVKSSVKKIIRLKYCLGII